MQGEVIKSTGKWYKVLLEGGAIVQASVKGKLRLAELKTTNPIAAGDVVKLTVIETSSETIYTIQSVEARKNYLVRKSTNLSKQMQIIAANIDRVYLVVTLKSPETQVAFIDRFLVAAESFRIPTTILFNKIDVYGQKEKDLMHYLTEIYE